MEPTVGLRERKKRETHRALTRSAQELVHQHGLEKVTVDEIADGAGVSVRTFFNYFTCKEEAIAGIDPGVLAEMSADLLARPADETPLDAVRAILTIDTDASAVLRSWRLRNELVDRYPALLPRHLATTVQVESALAAALAERMGVDIASDPAPRAIVAAVLAIVRATLSWWYESDRSIDLPEALDVALALLAPSVPPTVPSTTAQRTP